MERKTRIWLGLGAAVLVGGATVDQAAIASAPAMVLGTVHGPRDASPAPAIRVAQAEDGVVVEGGEGGEGEGGEGGGQVLGTIQEFRLQSTDPNAYDYDAAAQVEAYGRLVSETYRETHAAAQAMQAAIAALLDAPSPETLAAARDAWIAAREPYARTEAYLFYAGPVDIPGGPIKRLNGWPVDTAFIDGFLADESIDLTRGAIVRMDQIASPAHVTTGWHAIEYLLWGEDTDPAGPGARPHTDFLAGEPVNERRREYLRIVTQLLVNDLGTLVPAWAPDVRNNYRASIVAMDKRNAIGRIFNGIAVLTGYEIALRRIGASLFIPGEHEPSRFSDNTTAEIAANLDGVRRVYFGCGFDSLVGALDPALAERVTAAFARADSAVAALDVPYDSILATAAGSAPRAEAEEAGAAFRDLGAALRAAGNRLGVLVVLPGV